MDQWPARQHLMECYFCYGILGLFIVAAGCRLHG